MLLGYKKRFVLPIKIGTKVHTCRKKRKINPKIGETLYMYSALRTKHCELITNKEKLISTQKVKITVKVLRRSKSILGIDVNIAVDGRKLNLVEMQQFAKFDGFESIADFGSFFATGVKPGAKIMGTFDLYHWTDLRY